MKTTAVIVARKGSTRIPNKMHQVVGKDSLVMRKLKQLLAASGIYQVYVGSDDDTIKDAVEKEGGRFVLREPQYCDEISTSVNDMVRNMLSLLDDKPDQILWAHPTNPFIEKSEYEHAIYSLAVEKNKGYNSLFSVNALKGHFWSAEVTPINFPPFSPLHYVAANLKPIYAQNGGIFIRPYKDMVKDGSLVAGKALMFSIDPLYGWDIDEPWQLEFAQNYALKHNL